MLKYTASQLNRLACGHIRFFAAEHAAGLYHASAYYLAHMLAGALLGCSPSSRHIPMPLSAP